jgi:hypothetical protein
MWTPEDILRRMADDPDFALAIEADPRGALHGLGLSPRELERIERAVVAVRGPRP